MFKLLQVYIKGMPRVEDLQHMTVYESRCRNANIS